MRVISVNKNERVRAEENLNIVFDYYNFLKLLRLLPFMDELVAACLLVEWNVIVKMKRTREARVADEKEGDKQKDVENLFCSRCNIGRN